MISLCFKWVGCGEGDFLQSPPRVDQSLKFAFRGGLGKGVFRMQLCDLDSEIHRRIDSLRGRSESFLEAFEKNGVTRIVFHGYIGIYTNVASTRFFIKHELASG